MLVEKDDSLGMVMIAIYVDDCLRIGTVEAVEEFINELEENNFDPTCKIVQGREYKRYGSCKHI
jgi:hypothetical protein